MLAKKKTYSIEDGMTSASPDPNADAPDQPNEAGTDEMEATDNPEEEASEGETKDEGDTAYLSSEALGGRKVKPGETITVKVMSVDEDGNAVIKCSDNKKMGGIAEAMSAFKEKE